MHPPRLVATSLVAVLLAGCGQAAPRGAAPAPTVATSATTEGIGAAEVGVPATAPLPATVRTRTPDLVADAPGLPRPVLAAAARIEGVEAAARIRRTVVVVTGPDGDTAELDAIVVDPEELRPLTPDATAQSVGVWERLAAGEVVVGHDVGHELGLDLGGAVTVAHDGELQVARVGAFAATGVPPLADVVVPRSLGRLLGIGAPTGVLLAVADGADVGAVADRVGEVLAGADVQTLVPPAPEQAAPESGSGHIAPFTYTDLGDGTIAIDPAWVAEWIVPVELPGIATTRCNRVMVPQLLAALQELQARGLYGHFEADQFGGCFVARRIDWSPDRPLSMHAWGIAIDFNTRDNWLGDTPQMDMAVVEVFERWGFEWGGRWSRPDGMHFELDRIVVPG